jgi:hypothetical protein
MSPGCQAETGQFRLERKGSLNIATERRIQLGEHPFDAEFAVDSLGNERGVWNQPNLVTIQAHSLRFKEFATYIRLKQRIRSTTHPVQNGAS